MRTLSIAALQIAPVAGDREATWQRFAGQVRNVAATLPGVRLVVAPEQHLSAPPPVLEDGPESVEAAAEDVPGPLTERLGALARETGLWLVPGTVYERAPGGVHNTALVIDPSGRLVATYRKVFPWQPYETCLPGDRFVCFDVPGVGRVGLAICYDGAFPETMRQLAWMGAEVILQPTLTPTIDRASELVLARANAIFNQVYVVNVNAAAPAGVGRSLVVDPEGLVRAQAGATEELLTDVLDLDAVTRVREHGAHGLNRVWSQLERYGRHIELPVYGGHLWSPPGVPETVDVP